MRNPIIFTTPRSGSTIICKLLGNISRQLYGHTNVLYEYFNTRLIDRQALNDKIEYTAVPVFDNQVIVPIKGAFQPLMEKEIQTKRLELLRKHPKHTIKIFPGMLPYVMEFIISEYDFVFLERRNKLEQFLSYCSIVHGQKTHYKKDDKDTVQPFPVLVDTFNIFVEMMSNYKKFQQTHEGITVYYEDFMSLGGNQQALANLLGLSDAVLTDCPFSTKPSPYDVTYENLISNGKEWIKYKPYVLDVLSEFN